MNLRSFDLNLLTVFDALFETQSVTRASTQLGMAQPALSHALKRLRLALEDELFIRTAQGMVPTPRAKLLAGPVREALQSLRAAIGGDKAFDPASGRVFKPSVIKEIAKLLKEIRALRNLCIVVCEQVLSFILEIADRILVMENGRIVHSDTREHVDEAAIARFLAV